MDHSARRCGRGNGAFLKGFGSSICPQNSSQLQRSNPSKIHFSVDRTGLDIYSKTFDITTFADNAVDYSSSNGAVSIDLAANITGQVLGVIAAPQHGGFADNDVLVDMFEVTGSAFDDVIRGSNASTYANSPLVFPDTNPFNELINNPGDNVLNGGAGNDVLEGRGGADTLNGGSGFDFASYESSPAAVTVRLADDTQTAIQPAETRPVIHSRRSKD